MRFAYSLQLPPAFSPSLLPARGGMPQPHEAPQGEPAAKAPAEVRFDDGLPEDLDQRVRLLGEW
jgi:hypothetical protein